MYIPKAFHEEDTDRLLSFMQRYSFATFTSVLEGELIATHLPILVSRRDEKMICSGHFAKANPHWRAISGQSNLIVFSGPHAYISPSHYEKVESVPTWNYVAVHAYGTGRIMDAEHETSALLALISTLILEHEPSYQAQWDSLSDKYRQGMLQGIVGFEMTVERLEGKAKLSQNRTPGEQESIMRAMLHSEDSVEQAVGHEMRGRLVQA